jgi:exodeoxyribonuclease V beta subunit
MIGDPKQAIYGFRGGDIRAYLAAAAEVAPQNRYSLTKNFRSAPNLIEAVNRFFAPPAAFVETGVSFAFAHSGREPKVRLLRNGQPLAKPLHLLWLDGGIAGEALSKTELSSRRRAAKETARRIFEMLGDNSLRICEDGGEPRPLTPADFAVLTVTNREAGQTQEECRKLGIAAVIYKAGDVFKSADAGALWAVLSAMAAPSRVALVRAALFTPLCGFSEAALLALGAESDVFAGHQGRFETFRQTWLAHGVSAALAAFAAAYNTFRLAAAGDDCERRLTNFRHLCELLREAEQSGLREPAALLRHLREKITASNEDGDAGRCEQRLESDSGAVKILTIHKSKGLQYNIVFCPFMMTRGVELKKGGGGGGRQWVVRGGARGGGLVLPVGKSARQRFTPEKLKEDLAEQTRLLYVALTRAICQCVLFAGNIKGAGAGCGILSALNYFGRLHAGGDALPVEDFLKIAPPCGTEPPFAKSAELLNHAAIERVNGGDFGRQMVGRDAPPAAAIALAPVPPTPEISDDTGLLSYSALAAHTRHTRDAGGALDFARAGAGDDEAPAAPPSTARRDPLPGGKAAGLCVHEILEKIDYAYAAASSVPPEVLAAAEHAAAHHGLFATSAPPAAAARRRRLLEILRNALATPLDDGAGAFRLCDVPRADTLREWEFFFRVPKKIPLENFCRAGLAFNAGAARRAGFMNGIVDLVFRRGGRYFFVDWKTDALGDFGADALDAAMRGRNYLFQAIVYCVALNNWLRACLGPAYDFSRHFGGGFYLFMRGIPRADSTGGETGAGVFKIRPALSELTKWTSDLAGPG